MNETVFAGVVTFNPDPERLMENLRSITPQVERVLVYDNASEHATNVIGMAGAFPNVDVHQAGQNDGIARALNWLADTAIAAGAGWLVTLDQDSVCSGDMVETLRAAVGQGVAIATPYIVDRNKTTLGDYRQLDLPPVQYFRQAARRGAITSGSLVDLAVLREVGAFDERFFIDYVDYDFNQRVLLAGYRIARVNGTYLLHEVGRAQRTWLWVPRKTLDGKWGLERFYSFGHNPTRCYYKARNRVLFSRKYWRFIGPTNEGVLQIPQQVALTVLFERQKLAKLRAFARGVRDGVRESLDLAVSEDTA